MKYPKYFLLQETPESVVDGGTGTQLEENEVPKEDETPALAALKKERMRRKELEQQLRELQGHLHSIDPEEYAQLKAEKEAADLREQERQQKELEDQKKYDELVRLQKERAAREKAELIEKLKEKEQLLSSIEKERIQTKIKDAVLSAWSKPTVNGNPELFDIAHSALTSQGVFQYNPESKTVEVIDTSTGDVLLDDIGSPMTIENYLVSTLKTEKPSLFLSQKKQGIGTNPPANGGVFRSPLGWEELKNLSPAQMARLGNKKK